MEKHKALLVRKCFYGKACNTFKGYFEFNNHNKSARNHHVLLKVGFFFMGVKYNLLPLETRISQLDLRDRVNNFSKGIKDPMVHCGIKAKLKTSTVSRKKAMLAEKRRKDHFELNKYI